MKLIICIAFCWALISCSESSTSSNSGTIRITGGVNNTLVSMANSKNPDINALKIDSIKIVNIRYLISEIFLFPENSSEGKAIKAGPFLFEGKINGDYKLITESEFPNGSYNKIKFEFHRFSESESLKYEADSIFKDFATLSRYSSIIEGQIYYDNNEVENFIFQSNQVANLTLDFDKVIQIDNNTQNLVLEIHPEDIFKKNGELLNPVDSKNQNDIENNLKTAVRAVKKD